MVAPLPDPFSIVTGLNEETRSHASYFWNNEKRGDANEAVVQQTLSGEGFFENASGHKRVPAGHVMLFTHDEPSSYGYPPDVTSPYKLRFVAFRLSGLRTWFDRLRAEFGAVLLMPAGGEASAALTEITRRFRNRGFRDRIQETELLHHLLASLYREQVAATQTLDPIEYGSHFLRDNFRSPANLKDVAARCGVSREHFIRAFGQRYGEPPGEMLRRLRLEQARRMLEATQLPVQDIAGACGYADANSFCRAYRQRYGASPGATRRS